MTIEEILEKQNSGQTISKEEVDYLISALGKAVAGKVPTGEKYSSYNEMMLSLTSALDSVRNTPEGQAQIRDAVAGRKEQRFIKRYSPFFDAILAGGDVMSSLSQIQSSKNAIRDLKRPSMPSIPGMDPMLDNAIRNAELGTMDAARAAAPAMQQLQDQYGQDMALAKSVGGGQASTVGALGQIAAMRRARGAANLVPLVDSVRAREQGRVDNLMQMRLNQRQQNYYNRVRQAQLNLDQYNQDVDVVGKLGSAARTNLRNSAQALLNQAPRVMARIGRGYNDKYSMYEDQLNRSLTRQAPKSYTPYSEPDIYGNQAPIQLDDNFQSSAFFNPFQ